MITSAINPQLSTFIKRSVSTLILAPIVLFITYLSGWLFCTLILMSAVIMAFEWMSIIRHAEVKGKKWQILGLGYIVIPCLSMLYLREHEKGLELVLFLLLCIWATDIGAYIFGSLLKGPKLMPKISPKKTWSGLIAGFILAAVVGLGTEYLDILPINSVLSVSLLISLFGQIGDLLESTFKRKFGVKDSGALIPGHGGLLDRVDSIVTAAPVLSLIVFLSGI